MFLAESRRNSPPWNLRSFSRSSVVCLPLTPLSQLAPSPLASLVGAQLRRSRKQIRTRPTGVSWFMSWRTRRRLWLRCARVHVLICIGRLTLRSRDDFHPRKENQANRLRRSVRQPEATHAKYHSAATG